MKIITPLIGFAVVLQLGCDGARVGSPKQLHEITSNEVAHIEQKLYIRDETESLVREKCEKCHEKIVAFHPTRHSSRFIFDHRLKVTLPSTDTGL